MTSYETLAVIYFGAFGAAAAVVAIPWWRRLVVLGLALTVAAAIVAMAMSLDQRVRAWLPHVYLAIGYWIPALLTETPAAPTAFERWLTSTEDRLRPVFPGVPSLARHLTELAYLACYPLVPAAFALVWIAGSPEDVNRFWTAVLAAGYSCYASLPWLVSRPPRLTGHAGPLRGGLGALNVSVLGRISHQLNTFPSGHVAVSLAAAGATTAVSSYAGLGFGLVAAAVAVGAAAGRYHYVLDVLLGVVVAAAALTVSFVVWP